MTDWLPNLRSILKLKGDLKGKITLKLFSDVQDSQLLRYENNSRNVTVNVNIASEALKDPAERQKFLEAVRQAATAEPDKPLLEVNASNEARTIVEIEDASDLLAYFRGKIPDDDVPILKAALFIKAKYDNHESVDQYKRELRERYGRRADIIANLCSAGYFATYFKPLYEELEKRPDFTRGMFVESYNRLVSTTPFVIFVNKTQSSADLIKETVRKIESNQSYGIKLINLHAIGRDNVQTLAKLLEAPDVTKHFTSEPSIDRSGMLMSAKIFI